MNNQQSHPILYSAPMVRARRAGIKTMTRRAVNPQPPIGWDRHCWFNAPIYGWTNEIEPAKNWHKVQCPYGQPGDLLWVKETFFAWGRWETRRSAKKGRDEWHFVDMTLECGHAYMYAADGDQPDKLGGKRSGGVTPQWWRRPAIFMPRVASRGLDEIVSVRAERLQDLSEADAIAEGCEPNYLPGRAYLDEPYKSGYVSLWQGINGNGSWKANPWAWVVNFRVLK